MNLKERVEVFAEGYKTGRKVWMHFSIMALALGFGLGIMYAKFFCK